MCRGRVECGGGRWSASGCLWSVVLAPCVACSMRGPCCGWGAGLGGRLRRRVGAVASVRTCRAGWSVAGSFPCPSGGRRPSSGRLAPPGATLASARRVFAHKIVPNGVQLWRRLCSPLGVPPDDDDYYIGVHGCADAAGVHIKRPTIGSEDSRSRLTNCTPAPHPFPTRLLATRARVTVAARCSP